MGVEGGLAVPPTPAPVPVDPILAEALKIRYPPRLHQAQLQSAQSFFHFDFLPCEL
jgi:hypothetical protein